MITTRDQLINALANNASRLLIDKASIANTAAGQLHSLWRATGQPGQGAIPTAVAVCNAALVGGLPFTQQTAPSTSYLGLFEALCANAGVTIELHDRLAHMGGLNGTLTTAQTVNLDLAALLATDNLDARKGLADYSDVQWGLEWYADTGATVANATVNVTYNDASTGNLTAVALAATRRASFMQILNNLIPAAAAGRYIRAVNSVTLSASTAVAGNFGVTATRVRGAQYLPLANVRFAADWAALGLEEIHNNSCLSLVQIASTTATGLVRARGKLAHG
jgi:hypothetical protein